ncbi:uncharacterized protein LOC104883865 isoform X1 [Beta vulgaris subsp. vulgaris]|uniref:uncharacterized protein LOC104883865 isoform X1 n=1 Tax=Beta vulgaris subsp. vulgaris TaxID=3555 RepID=UPI002036E918|nr:uncharacterized protein LOC104883865 isoform X1 [Beta vulgaris subsp. vulgaris]
MGQALRRATGKLRNTNIDTSSSAPSPIQHSFDRAAKPVSSGNNVQINNKDFPSDRNSTSNAQVLEERDPTYEVMLSQMAGKIKTKPGGKLEMGEASVVQKTQRPLPRIRNTSPDAGRYEERPVAAGTLNVAQLRHIMLLHKGKDVEQDKQLGLKEVAENFRVDAVQLEKVFKYVSLPPENNTSRKTHELED